MRAKGIEFAAEDITTIHEALKGTDGKRLARALLGEGSPGCPNRAHATRIAARRAESMLSVLKGLEPNLEATSGVVLPWKAAHLSSLSSMSWPDALGTRIALPSKGAPESRHRLIADVLLSMSYV